MFVLMGGSWSLTSPARVDVYFFMIHTIFELAKKSRKLDKCMNAIKKKKKM